MASRPTRMATSMSGRAGPAAHRRCRPPWPRPRQDRPPAQPFRAARRRISRLCDTITAHHDSSCCGSIWTTPGWFHPEPGKISSRTCQRRVSIPVASRIGAPVAAARALCPVERSALDSGARRHLRGADPLTCRNHPGASLRRRRPRVPRRCGRANIGRHQAALTALDHGPRATATIGDNMALGFRVDRRVLATPAALDMSAGELLDELAISSSPRSGAPPVPSTARRPRGRLPGLGEPRSRLPRASPPRSSCGRGALARRGRLPGRTDHP